MQHKLSYRKFPYAGSPGSDARAWVKGSWSATMGSMVRLIQLKPWAHAQRILVAEFTNRGSS